MLRACKILDEGGVRRVTGVPSGRALFLVSSPTFRSPQMFVLRLKASDQLTMPVVLGMQVMGESKRKEEYICFPEHLCTCYSFFYDIVGRGEQLCVSAPPVTLVSVHVVHSTGKMIHLESTINIGKLQLQLLAPGY